MRMKGLKSDAASNNVHPRMEGKDGGKCKQTLAIFQFLTLSPIATTLGEEENREKKIYKKR